MKHYSKPTLEITKLATDMAFASGSPTYTKVGEETDSEGMPITVYEITSFEATSQNS